MLSRRMTFVSNELLESMLSRTSLILIHVVMSLNGGVDLWELSRGGELGRSRVDGRHGLSDGFFIVLVCRAIHNICVSS